MVFVKEFHGQNLIDSRLPEPRKPVVREKILYVIDKEPKTMLIDVADFNPGSACAMH